MPVLLALLAATGLIVLAHERGRWHFAPGVHRVCLPPGADPGVLPLLFSSVSDAGGGCFVVTAASDFMTSALPAGTRVEAGVGSAS